MLHTSVGLKQILAGLSSTVRKKPRLVIDEIFRSYNLQDHRWYVESWMDSVNSNSCWKGSYPSDLFLYYRDIKDLVNAAYVINKEKKKQKTARDLLRDKGMDIDKNLLHPALYFGWQPYGTIWDFFPRRLDREEYIDPYLAISRFFKFRSLEKWHDELYCLLVDGLSGFDAPHDPINGTDFSCTGKHLHKLIEAAHLINVREMEYMDDRRKRFIYALDQPLTNIILAKMLGMDLSEEDLSMIIRG